MAWPIWGDVTRVYYEYYEKSCNENEGSDIPKSGSIDLALRLRNMGDVSK